MTRLNLLISPCRDVTHDTGLLENESLYLNLQNNPLIIEFFCCLFNYKQQWSKNEWVGMRKDEKEI